MPKGYTASSPPAVYRTTPPGQIDSGETLNDMLEKRGLQKLSVEEYKDVFGFPVVDFYKKVGFDMEKESLHEISVDFVETYDRFAGNITLNQSVPEVLCGIQQAGRKQSLYSSTESFCNPLFSSMSFNVSTPAVMSSNNVPFQSQTKFLYFFISRLIYSRCV